MTQMVVPEDFIRQTKTVADGWLWEVLQRGLANEAPVSVRLNPQKCPDGSVEVVGTSGKVPWCEYGYYLTERPNFTFDPLFHAGAYYVQEASSMFLAHILRRFCPKEAVTMLDLCAAPGGKSTVARTVLPEGSLLVCNEPVPLRAQILAENIRKFGHPDVIVTNNYPRDFGRGQLDFDVLLADVPCSGEGMFRKDPAATDEWSLQNVEKCWRLQREIVTDAWPCLKPGGLFVYSTCTFNTKEDEENVRFICEELGADVLDCGVESGWNVTGSLLTGFNEPVCRFIPGLTLGEGLFVAVMRKHGETKHEDKPSRQGTSRTTRRKQRSAAVTDAVSAWIKNPDGFEITTDGDTLTAIPTAWKNVYDAARKHLRVLSAGVELGNVKGKDIVPSQALALSTAFNSASFHHSELDYAQAISYLRRETVTLPTDIPRGHVAVTYMGVPLGFVKNIGNRANNLYPAEWKIKSSHVPDGKNEIIKIRIEE